MLINPVVFRAVTAYGAATLLLATSVAALQPEVVHSIGAVPPHLAGRFREPWAFQQAASGQYFVFDRRDHTVYGLDDAQSSVWPIVRIGGEAGRILRPTAFSVAPNGTFVVADAPGAVDRIQVFTPVGFPIAAFLLPIRTRPRITIDNFVLNGVGSLQHSGTSILISQPETGGLITEYSVTGHTSRTFGELRETGHEDDPDLHLALNSGIPLVDPRGGFYFVFQAGTPMFRKYDATGHMMFERRIQGLEIDQMIAALPAIWRRREGELPVVTPSVRAAAVDPEGHLWVSCAVPYTYVFDPQGDKVRTIQFRGAGTLSPASLFFGSTGRLLVTPGLYEFEGSGRKDGAAIAVPVPLFVPALRRTMNR